MAYTNFSIQFKKTTDLSAEHKLRIIEIWNSVYPATLSYSKPKEFDEYLSRLGDIRHYLAINKDQLVGWMPVFEREGEPWFAILMHTDFQGNGVGKNLLNFARQEENLLNGWVIDKEGFTKQNGEPYHSPLPFYLQQGFQVLPGTRLESAELSAVKIRWIRK